MPSVSDEMHSEHGAEPSGVINWEGAGYRKESRRSWKSRMQCILKRFAWYYVYVSLRVFKTGH